MIMVIMMPVSIMIIMMLRILVVMITMIAAVMIMKAIIVKILIMMIHCTNNHIFFQMFWKDRLSKKLQWNMIFLVLSGEMVFFPRKHDLILQKKKKKLKYDIFVYSVKMVFLLLTNMILLFCKKVKMIFSKKKKKNT